MSDLISRQAAIDALDERCESECEYSKKQRSVMCNACYLGSAKEVVEELPTIEPKRGKWIYDKGLYKCTACNNVLTVAGWDIPEEQIYKSFKFCPNCGAKMERSESCGT